MCYVQIQYNTIARKSIDSANEKLYRFLLSYLIFDTKFLWNSSFPEHNENK